MVSLESRESRESLGRKETLVPLDLKDLLVPLDLQWVSLSLILVRVVKAWFFCLTLNIFSWVIVSVSLI